MNENTEIITYKQWDGYAIRVMNKNLKKFGRSLTQSGISRRANDFILEIQSDRNGHNKRRV